MTQGIIASMIIGVGSAIVGGYFGYPIYISVTITVMLISVGMMK